MCARFAPNQGSTQHVKPSRFKLYGDLRLFLLLINLHGDYFSEHLVQSHFPKVQGDVFKLLV